MSHAGDCIFLRGIEVSACHGVLAEERTRPQRFVIDAEVWLETDDYGRSDDYRRAVCYGAILDTIVEVAGGPHKSLVEALALAIVDALLRRFQPIDAVRITIHKPEAPLRGKFADVGVSLMRRRSVRR
ncbi:dihydroneopterin aldolase [Reyranella sp.]|uniref:dihydroneopterin aldolase n=1 Tax=Reyranella sp. TaxID=1929291 RepID=UPI003BA95F95